jgi:hypothetical protein
MILGVIMEENKDVFVSLKDRWRSLQYRLYWSYEK